MNVLIVDDESLARERLRALVEEFSAAETSPGYCVVGEAANGKEALRVAGETAPDVVLMDIRMPGMDGLEAAQHLNTLGHPPAVIFTTAYDDHALAAFEAHAVDYLVKPIRKQRLYEALQRARVLTRAQIAALDEQALKRRELTGGDGDARQARARTHLSALRHGRIELVPVAEIFYFHADHKYVTVKHADGEVLIEDSLISLEEEFKHLFTRVHRNALVANACLIGMEKTADGHFQVLMRGCADQLPISRAHVAEVRRKMKERTRE